MAGGENTTGRIGEERGSVSSRTVSPDIACTIVFRPDEIEVDIRLSIRLARFDFFSFSSPVVVPVEDEDRAVGGGEKAPLISRPKLERRLLIESGRWAPGLAFAWAEGGPEGDRTEGADADGSMEIERRRSEKDAREIKSFTTVTEDLRSRVVLVSFDALEDVDSLLSRRVSFGGFVTALWWLITKGDCLRSRGAYSEGSLPTSDFVGNG